MPPQMWQSMPMGVMRKSYPSWLQTYGIVAYILSLAVVSMVNTNYSLPWYYMVIGVVCVTIFYLYGRTLSNENQVSKVRKTKTFERRIFTVAFVARLVSMVLLYTIFSSAYGDSFGFESADASSYDEMGQFVAGLMSNGNFNLYDEIAQWSGNNDISDMGYGIYVGFIYWLTDNSIIVVRLLKCLLSAWAVVLIYRLARRNFEEPIARNAAIFVALWPNFWYYCAVHLKETEMTFLAVLFVEQADQMLRSRQFTAWKIIPILLIAALIFTFRTPLGLVALLALIFSVVMSSSRVVSWGKRIIVGFLAVLLIAVVAGNRIQEQSRGLIEQVQSGQQEKTNISRSERKGGNSLAKYAGSAVFAPMIFTLPFPSMVRPFEGQEVQQLLNGGNFVKNILSAFTILAMVTLLMSGKWREHLLPLSFMLGYLAVLAMSNFAQSERFHQPAMPFEFMFAAYGLSIAVTKPKYKRWFMYWCGLMLVAAIVWNWFKLAGRGLT